MSADEAGPCAERGTARPEGAEVIAEFAFRVAHARADRSRVRRTLIPVVIATTIVGAVIAAASVANAALPAVQAAEVAPVHAAPGAPDVVVYGDSLAWEASDAVVAAAARAGLRAQVTSFGGLALCDELGALRHDLATRRPRVVVLEFAGNSFTPCMRDGRSRQLVPGSSAYGARWKADIRAAVEAAARVHVPLVWAIAPLPRARAGADAVRQLTAAARSVARSRSGMVVADVGASVLEHGRFTDTLPCGPGDSPGLGCVDGRIVVRSADGIHLCPGDAHADRGVVGACPVYSSGARRFAGALVDAARRAP